MRLGSLHGEPLATRITVILLLAIAAAACCGFLAYSRRKARLCSQNLQKIYGALVDYEDRFGFLPKLAFYPDDARLDPDSVTVKLAAFGVLESDCICPSSPAVLQDAGITYLWNIALNMQRLEDFSTSTWVMVEIHSLSSSVPAPHLRTYNILFTDGRVTKSRRPPDFP